MAIALSNKETEFGFTAGSVYVRIERLKITRNKLGASIPKYTADIDIVMYATEGTPDEQTRPIGYDFLSCEYDIAEGQNVFAWAYGKVKALEQFTGATDA